MFLFDIYSYNIRVLYIKGLFRSTFTNLGQDLVKCFIFSLNNYEIVDKYWEEVPNCEYHK